MNSKNRSTHRLLILFLFQILPAVSFAQFTTLLDFGGKPDGYYPYGAPVSDGTFLYGMTVEGGSNDLGTLYKIKPDGSGFSKLFDFDGSTNGSSPYGSLLYDGTFLYGMTSGGGANSQGTIFKIKPDGTSFTKLFDFSYTATGAYPYGGLISDGTFLYGMTSQGGAGSYGIVFKIKADGTGFIKLLEFDGTTNGAYPYGSLFSDGTFLYGTTSGGFSFLGTAFKIKTDGTGYTTLINFNGTGNGSSPYGDLISDGTFLYGTTLNGGSGNFGTIFKIKPDASGFVKLVDFDNTTTKGAYPKGSLVSDGTFLYGTTTDYGLNGRGTIFKVKTDGTGYLKLFDNEAGTTNSRAEGTLLLNGTTLYGAKSGGGAGVAPFLPGTLYKINTDGTGYSRLFNFEVEGNSPSGSPTSDGTFLYGMTTGGGLYDYGTIFKTNPDGTGYTKLLDFLGTTNGMRPYGDLTLDGTFLYGMTNGGGVNDAGTIFKIKPDGTGYVKLFDFNDLTTGSGPYGSLISDGTFLYGMTTYGGANSYGTIFKIKPDGTGYTKLHDLDYINDGAYPNGSLYSDGTFLYGTTYQGGADGGWGTIFKIKPDGTGFVKLFDFDSSAGSNPYGTLISDGTFLYGMTNSGGVNSDGTIFKIKTDGTAFSKLLEFDGANTGSFPYGSLFSDGTFLYGMTSGGGINGNGTIFKIKPDATSYSKLFDFNYGSNPHGTLISDGTFLYGMTSNGGISTKGTLFKSSLTPYVSIADFILSSGVVGSTVTIYGTNFDVVATNNIVSFNGTTATVTSATVDSLTVIVPVGATTGPISVTAGGTTANSINDFEVTTEDIMVDGVVQNCDVQFLPPSGDYIQQHHYNDVTQTFVPVNPSDKVKVSFSSFSVEDILYVYDGPTANSPLLATLNGSTLPADIVATGAGGELTFVFSWQDASSDWLATISCQAAGNSNVVITSVPLTTTVGGKITLDLVPLITTTNNNLDLASLQVVSPPSSGANASISAAGILTIDYNGRIFVGTEQVTIKACDTDGNCSTQQFSIDVAADIVVYNGISPNGVNPSFIIENIDVLPDTKNNTVYIFDRWENEVWHGTNYNNTSVVFTGVSDNGSDLPTGVYYYKIEFVGGRKKLTGFISLRRK